MLYKVEVNCLNIHYNNHVVTGEMGGFMGLLLGGSVLTLCEILDFIVHNATRGICKKCKKNKVSASQTQLIANA